jgi:negative regulator of sigma E activity
MNDKTDQEWRAQELALRHERQPAAAGHDSRARAYQLIVRALRVPSTDTLPQDFAARVARRAAAAYSSRFETVLMIVLMVALGICTATIVARFGHEWVAKFDPVFAAADGKSGGWLLVLAGCLGASWLLDKRQRRAR